MQWKKRTKRVTDLISKRRYWTTVDDQYQIVYTESLLLPKPYKKLSKQERSKYLSPRYLVFIDSGDGYGYTWLTRKYFRTFKAAERAIVQAQR